MSLVVYSKNARLPKPAPKVVDHEAEKAREAEAARKDAIKAQLRVHLDEAQYFMSQRNTSAASEVFNKMLAIDPSCVAALDGLDRVRMDQVPVASFVDDAFRAQEEAARNVLQMWTQPRFNWSIAASKSATQSKWMNAARRVRLEQEMQESQAASRRRECCGCGALAGSLAGSITAQRLKRAHERHENRDADVPSAPVRDVPSDNGRHREPYFSGLFTATQSNTPATTDSVDDVEDEIRREIAARQLGKSL